MMTIILICAGIVLGAALFLAGFITAGIFSSTIMKLGRDALEARRIKEIADASSQISKPL